MKRIIVMVLKNIIFVPYYWIMLNWYAAHVDKYTEEQRYAMLTFPTKMALCFIRIIRDYMTCLP